MFKNINKQGEHIKRGCAEKGGYIAVTVVVVLSFAIIFFTQVTASSIMSYVDMVYRREWRTQARYNAESCLEMVYIMTRKDYFLNGDVYVGALDCHAYVVRDYIHQSITITVKASFAGVSSDKVEKDFLL